MLGLPKSTEFNKIIQKNKFYEHLTVSPTLKRSFVEQIRSIYWRNKIATTTVNLAAGQTVTEVEVFEIRLNQQSLDQAVLKQIDTEIPYHILFLLEFEGKYQAWIGYKEAAVNNAFKVSAYYHTDWMEPDKLPVKLEGLNLDAVYENFVRQIAGDKLTSQSTESLKDSIEREEKRQKLEKQISVLLGKVRKEKQFNKQVELNAELKQLRMELKGL